MVRTVVGIAIGLGVLAVVMAAFAWASPRMPEPEAQTPDVHTPEASDSEIPVVEASVDAHRAHRRGTHEGSVSDVARRGLLEEFAKLREQLVSDEEVERAKTYAIGTHAIRQQSGGAVLGDITDAWLLGSLAELDEYEQRVRAVTPADMQRVARRYFDEGRMVQGIVRGVGKAV